MATRPPFVPPVPLLDIQTDAFAKQYESGVWWQLYGEEQGTGPLLDHYLVTVLQGDLQCGTLTCEQIGAVPWLGFSLGMYHGGVLSPQTSQLRPDVSTLATFQHPEGARGYEAGRRDTFSELAPHERRMREDELVRCLRDTALDSRHWTMDPEGTWYYVIGLEDLSRIRERTTRRTRRRKKRGTGTKHVSPKARKANQVYSQWSFAELQSLISYKAALAGSLAIKVDADYTSKQCPMCGHMTDANRPHKGLRFACENPACGYTLHADLIGARNITMRTLLVRQDWTRTGFVSMAPDASDREAKAARLQRYAGLRWSPGVTNTPPVRDQG